MLWFKYTLDISQKIKRERILLKKNKIWVAGVWVLSFVLILAFASPPIAKASSSELSKNIELRYTSDTSWEYTQNKNGEMYKIVENVNPEKGTSHSLIYKLNNKGEYVLETKQNTRMSEDGVLTIKKTDEESGEITKQTRKADKIEIEEEISQEDLIQPSYDPTDPLTPWTFASINDITINPEGLTISALAGIISSALGLPALGSIAVSLATGILSSNITDSVYLYQKVYTKELKGTYIVKGTKKYNYAYKSSARRSLISGPNISIDCAPGYSGCE